MRNPSDVEDVLSLPAEVVRIIGKYSSRPTLSILSKTCLSYFHLLKDDHFLRLAQELLGYVLYPTPDNVKKAKALYRAQPKLLFIESEAAETVLGGEEHFFDEQGRHHIRRVQRQIKNTPFGAALGTGDSDLFHDMATVLHQIEYKNENGEPPKTGFDCAIEQINHQFPHGFAPPPCDNIFNEWMVRIATAITHDQTLKDNNTASFQTGNLIAQFQKEFSSKVVTQGHHYNLNHLKKAFETHNQYWTSWNHRQLSLFWCRVIGYLEFHLPLVDAQALCQGTYHLLEEKNPLERTLSLSNYEQTFHIPIHDFSLGLGLDYGIQISPYGWLSSKWGSGGGISRAPNIVESLSQAKTSALSKLKNWLTKNKLRAHLNL